MVHHNPLRKDQEKEVEAVEPAELVPRLDSEESPGVLTAFTCQPVTQSFDRSRQERFSGALRKPGRPVGCRRGIKWLVTKSSQHHPWLAPIHTRMVPSVESHQLPLRHCQSSQSSVWPAAPILSALRETNLLFSIAWLLLFPPARRSCPRQASAQHSMLLLLLRSLLSPPDGALSRSPCQVGRHQNQPKQPQTRGPS